MARDTYSSSYSGSHALIIGIDAYKNLRPLSYAVNDARAVAALLTSKLGFPEERVHLLLNEDATRDSVMRSYLSYTDSTHKDDRVLIYFAGHGHTTTGNRGETGFLVPVDGELDDLSTLIRWDELTRSSDLIPAKHMLFVMDACYGGLVFSRSPIPPGSRRLLSSMRQRYARQVLTAGKGDEVVADGNGARPGHSLFASHFLSALEGAGSPTEGVITANGVMSYVFEKVGSDHLSRQTPDYGCIEGDGDFIFLPYESEPEEEQPSAAEEQLVQIPAAIASGAPEQIEIGFEEKVKELLPDPTQQIRLDDLLSNQLRNTIQALSLERFPVSGVSFSNEEFVQRLGQYEEAVEELAKAMIAIVRWGSESQLNSIETTIKRLAEIDKGQSGLTVWINMGWYPLSYLLYIAGIAAVYGKRYDALRLLLLTPVTVEKVGGAEQPVILPAMMAVANLHDAFKTLPGLENRRTPRSDYLYDKIQPILEDRLIMGRGYEAMFDEFESIIAVQFADTASDSRFGAWGPPGRFAWKMVRDRDEATFNKLIKRAETEGDNWPPIRAGLFSSSAERFLTSAKALREIFHKRFW